ncbi:hypothetical protein NP493_37g09006 [Ridgeia piscesae]|uniref:Uncharacterized protein n=1 Tax=Ridgeia piscesae TaxID=27915 RepID=A0AAD9PCB8_RIDPI|nr:hypothetical protein NP493_37g09006 [Ridgeia piscesae]
MVTMEIVFTWSHSYARRVLFVFVVRVTSAVEVSKFLEARPVVVEIVEVLVPTAAGLQRTEGASLTVVALVVVLVQTVIGRGVRVVIRVLHAVINEVANVGVVSRHERRVAGHWFRTWTIT